MEDAKTLFIDIETFCHKRNYMSAITMSPKEREAFDLKEKGKDIGEIMAKMNISKTRYWNLIKKANEKHARQRDLEVYIDKQEIKRLKQ